MTIYFRKSEPHIEVHYGIGTVVRFVHYKADNHEEISAEVMAEAVRQGHDPTGSHEREVTFRCPRDLAEVASFPRSPENATYYIVVLPDGSSFVVMNAREHAINWKNLSEEARHAAGLPLTGGILRDETDESYYTGECPPSLANRAVFDPQFENPDFWKEYQLRKGY